MDTLEIHKKKGRVSEHFCAGIRLQDYLQMKLKLASGKHINHNR